MSNNSTLTCVGCGEKPQCASTECKHCTDAGFAFAKCQVRVTTDNECGNLVCIDFGCRTACHDCGAIVCTPCFQDCGSSCMYCDHDLCDECAVQCKECGNCFCCAHAMACINAGVCSNCTESKERAARH